MRHAPGAVLVLVDRARRKLADKRGAGEAPLSLDEHDAALSANPADLIALDDAPGTLVQLDARAASVVELRVFAGLTIDETAQALDIHPSSMNREWAHASAWLKQQPRRRGLNAASAVSRREAGLSGLDPGRRRAGCRDACRDSGETADLSRTATGAIRALARSLR